MFLSTSLEGGKGVPAARLQTGDKERDPAEPREGLRAFLPNSLLNVDN